MFISGSAPLPAELAKSIKILFSFLSVIAWNLTTFNLFLNRGAYTPWYRVKLDRGGAIIAISFSINSCGVNFNLVVPSEYGFFKW